MTRLRLLAAAAGLLGLCAAWPALAQAPSASLPPDLAARKTLTVALFAAFPPMAYKVPETNALTGVDVDLAADVARRLGLGLAWQDTSYESAVNALATGRVDLAFSMLDAPEAADRLDYLPYLTTGMQAYTLASHAPIAAPLDLCGLKVSANRRNRFDAAMRRWSTEHCLPAGRPAIEVQEADGTPAARLQLRQGRVDATVQSSESVPYTMGQEPGVYAMIGAPLTQQLIVIAFPKSATVLRQAVTEALRAAVADGSYAVALAKFGLERNSAASLIQAR